MSTRKQIADGLKRAANSYFLKKGFACHNEIAITRFGRFKVDMLAVNLRSELIIAEIKSCPADFKTDNVKGKWREYLFASNKYYWVFTEDTAEKLKSYFADFKEVGCGVLVLDSHTGYLRCILNAKTRSMRGSDKKYIITRLAWRSADISKRNSRRCRVFL
jgi:hypothetical protein